MGFYILLKPKILCSQGLMNNMDRLECTVIGFFNDKTDLYEEYIAASNQMRGRYR